LEFFVHSYLQLVKYLVAALMVVKTAGS